MQKTYRNRGRGLVQTFLRRSRAAREFDNLSAACAAGLPCTEPLQWRERRRFGLVLESTLVTRWAEDCTPVREVLRAGAGRTQRRWLLAEMGRLVARLHRAGILWCTLTPRNFLLQGEPGRGRLLLCDMPAAVRLPDSIHRRPVAEHDLYDAAFSASRCRDFDRFERRRLLLAYAEGDRGYVRDLERRLAGRSRRAHRLRKGLRKTLSTYLRPLWGLFARRRRSPA